MHKLQSVVVLTVLCGAVLSARAQPRPKPPEDTSRVNRIKVACGRDRVRVRVFDDKGKSVGDDVVMLTAGQREYVFNDSSSAAAAKRFVTTSATRGCVRGEGRQDDATRAPINTFDMRCNNDRSIDLVLTANPKATFTVRRQVPVKGDTQCRWIEPIFDGSPVEHFTNDQALIIEAAEVSGEKRGYLVLDWNNVPHQTNQKQTFPKEKLCRPGQNLARCSENSKTLVPTLTSIVIEARDPQ